MGSPSFPQCLYWMALAPSLPRNILYLHSPNHRLSCIGRTEHGMLEASCICLKHVNSIRKWKRNDKNCPSVHQSVNQSVSQSVSQSVGESLISPAHLSVNHLLGKPFNQPHNQVVVIQLVCSVCESVGKSVRPLVIQSFSHSQFINQPVLPSRKSVT